VQRSAVLRLRILALVICGGHGTLLLLGLVHAELDTARPWLVPGLGFGVVLWLATRIKALSAERVIVVSCLCLIGVAFSLSGVRYRLGANADAAFVEWPPAAVLLVLFGALVPMSPSRLLTIALFAGLMDPLAYYLLAPDPSGVDVVTLAEVAAAPLAAAGLAWLCSLHVYGLTKTISKAREIGSYRLASRLGVGGMGEVWSARHNLLARPAAIKLIRPAILLSHGIPESRRLLRLFEREAQTTARLTSPHTIQLYDYGVTKDGTFFYVMELLDGFDLQTLVKNFGRQAPGIVVHLLEQATHSLHEAHAHHLVHRDLKPANIFTCRYGGEVDFVKILDFGLVMDRRPTEEELEQPGLVGTPAVMAPEMVRYDAPVDQRADIYALGCVAYWLLTGQRVFEAQSRADMLIMHAHQRPVPPSRRAGVELPVDLERLVLDCLQKDPGRRPQSARELGDRLRALTVPLWDRNERERWWSAQPPPAPGV
jgi:eukaryotic-like serine/threonine-protein kinase